MIETDSNQGRTPVRPINSPIGFDGLNLRHIEGNQWFANTPDGFRAVTYATDGISPVIGYHRGDGVLVVAQFPELADIIALNRIPSSLWPNEDTRF